MSILNFNIGLNASVRLPRVVRYIDEVWVEDFLDRGAIRLTSFRRCAKHDDAERHDAREGRLALQATAPDGSTLSAITLPSPNLYVLCCSTALDIGLRDQFKVSSGFVIRDVFRFAAEIAVSLADCRAVAHGPCFYCPEMTRTATLEAPIFTKDPESEEDLERIPEAINRIDQLESVFNKPAKPFMSQHEYRFIWIMGHDVEEYKEVKSPTAAGICERADFNNLDD